MHINLNAMGTRMKRRRKELKMSQAELAEKVNVSNNHISSIETGKQIPSWIPLPIFFYWEACTRTISRKIFMILLPCATKKTFH